MHPFFHPSSPLGIGIGVVEYGVCLLCSPRKRSYVYRSHKRKAQHNGQRQVGFSLEKEIEIPVGKSECKALVFIEIPGFTGSRGILLSCSCSDVYWQMQLS